MGEINAYVTHVTLFSHLQQCAKYGAYWIILGMGRWVKCELTVMEKSRSWKKRNDWKNEDIADFLPLKSDSPVWTGLCICWCLWGHWEGGGGSNVRWRWCKSPDLGKKEMLIRNLRTHQFPPFKKQFPCMMTGLHICWCLWGHWEREGGSKWDGCGGEVEDLKKRNAHKT
jgi:hypothetical protein